MSARSESFQKYLPFVFVNEKKKKKKRQVGGGGGGVGLALDFFF